MKPMIGITCSYDDNEKKYSLASCYARAIEAAGGLAVLIPFIRDTSDLREILLYLDGLLLTGGGDIDPVFFNEEPDDGTGPITPARDVFEIEITRMAIDRDYPVLGICRGIQLINIAAGGKIHQDLRSAIDKPVKHMQEAPRWYPTHRINIVEGTKVAGIFNIEEIQVNSFHHQVVSELAPDYIASAYSGDGLIEAIESTQEKFVVGVQFHPEHLWEKNDIFLNLFKSFITAAK